MNKKLAELSGEELAQVTGGFAPGEYEGGTAAGINFKAHEETMIGYMGGKMMDKKITANTR